MREKKKDFTGENKGFSGKDGLILVILFLFFCGVMGMLIMYLGYVRFVEEGFMGYGGNDNRFVKPDSPPDVVNSNLVSVSDFGTMALDRDVTGIAGSGDFTGAFTNTHDFPIEIKEITLSDKVSGKVCQLRSTKGDRIPAKGYFSVSGINCVMGYPGDPYAARITIVYGYKLAETPQEKTILGSIRGYFV